MTQVHNLSVHSVTTDYVGQLLNFDITATRTLKPGLYIIVRNVTTALAVIKYVLEIETIIWKQRWCELLRTSHRSNSIYLGWSACNLPPDRVHWIVPNYGCNWHDYVKTTTLTKWSRQWLANLIVIMITWQLIVILRNRTAGRRRQNACAWPTW